MTRNTRETLYPGTRLSAKMTPRGADPVKGAEPEQPVYALIEALRSVREQGYDAFTAAERYDPDFSIDLSRCHDEAEVDAMLDRWHARRIAILDDTRAALKRIWREHHSASSLS